MRVKNVLPALLLSALTLLLNGTPGVCGHRILAAFIFPGKSHFMMNNVLVRELVKRGHEVTYLTPFSLESENLGPNYKEILIPVFDFWPIANKVFNIQHVYELASMPNSAMMKMMDAIGVQSADFALQQPQIQSLINDNSTDRFDLLLIEQFYNEALLAFSYKYNIPIVTASTFGFTNYLSQMVGVISPWSYVPHAYYPLTDRMNFWERVENSIASFYEDMYRRFVYLPKQSDLVKKHFSHLPVEFPDAVTMERATSMQLLNSYMPLTSPRPVAFNMVSVGGIHIYPTKPLPQDMQKFLDEARDGAIYFSLGSNVRSADMPPEKLKIFLKVLGGLKQRVLWKYEDESIKDLPSNIMIKKWLPQNDILAHRNVKVFITHGGLFGTQEGVYHGVPMLGIPIYADQFLNIYKAEKGGYAINLRFEDITEEKLRGSLVQLLENPEFSENMKRVSSVFRDRPIDAKEEAIYWIEYVIRHKGAPHMRAVGTDLPWYQFYLLDVIVFIASGVLAIVALVFWVVRKALASLRPKKLKRS